MSIERSLAVLGSPSVGKSALINCFTKGKFTDEYIPTISGTSLYSLKVRQIEYNLTLYDTAGLERQSHIPAMYIKSSGFLLVYSITDRQSFEVVQDVYNKLLNELDGENKPIVLIGNKSDLNQNRVVNQEEGKELARNMNGAAFIETSAKLGNNVMEVYLTLLNQIDPVNNAPIQQPPSAQQRLPPAPKEGRATAQNGKQCIIC